jgi:hypothetical protein
METFAALHARRLEHWCQTPATRVADAPAAVPLIQRAGVVTLFPASPEVPDLYHAHMGDPSAATEAKWDSPSGEVYTWRWTLGRQEAAFYSVLVRGRPTWVSWELLPAVLRLWGDPRTPDELADLGVLSRDAYRVAQALDEAGGVLGTGELREAAGFPTGKAERSAYLKAVDELDRRLLLAKVFRGDSDDLSHALVGLRYREHTDAAERMSREEALERFLLAYLPQAVYAAPAILARHLKLGLPELLAGLDRLVAAGQAVSATFPEQKGECYVWGNGARDA